MQHLQYTVDLGAESGEDTTESVEAFEFRLESVRDRLREQPANMDSPAWRQLRVQEGRLLINLNRNSEAFDVARTAFTQFTDAAHWQEAIEATQVMFLSEQDGALVALGHGVWLSVTFPVSPRLTLSLLQYIVDDTPENSDGAAVAAATAAHVVNLRAEGQEREDLVFFSSQLLGTVARQHSGIEQQTDFDAWAERLELNDPGRFLPRLRNVVDVLVQGDWWIDRDAIQASLPH